VWGTTLDTGVGTVRRRRRVVRLISRALATVAVGGLLGFLVPTIAADLAQPPVAAARDVVPESPLAREFIDAYAADDQAALTALGVTSDLKLRASRHRADFAAIDSPVHLGSYLGGGFTLHAYAARVVLPDGAENILSWRVVTVGGQVALILPPGGIEPP
jgi:hypothetical protein